MLKFVRDNRFVLAVLAFGLITANGCSVRKNSTQVGFSLPQEVYSDMQVTLDVFSGRPNPSWILSADEAQELARRLHGLPSAVQLPREGDLGYRGFRIVTTPQRSKLPTEIAVGQNLVTVRDDSGTRHYTDANGIELWLLEQARRRGFGSLVEGQAG